MSSLPPPAERPFATVAVLGLGAMGGSLARALSALEPAPTVVGWSPLEAERAAALEASAIVSSPDAWQEAVAIADLVVVAAPLGATCRLLQEVADTAPSGATLSDVASLKEPVARAAAAAGVQDRWVGTHPMAGSAESGFGASAGVVYRGASVWTVAHESAATRVGPVHDLWRSLEAHPLVIEADAHDRMMAMASHLPQLVANALASVLVEGAVPRERLGPGGAGMTRLAGSDSTLWRDILEHASPELVDGLRAHAETARRIADLLEKGDLEGIERIMKSTRAWARSS